MWKNISLYKKSAGIDQYSASIIDEENFVLNICNDQNVNLVIRAIQDSVDKNKQYILQV